MKYPKGWIQVPKVGTVVWYWKDKDPTMQKKCEVLAVSVWRDNQHYVCIDPMGDDHRQWVNIDSIHNCINKE